MGSLDGGNLSSSLKRSADVPVGASKLLRLMESRGGQSTAEEGGVGSRGTPARSSGRVVWYNGRRQTGRVKADDGCEFTVPVGGALNRNLVPLTPAGLMHGTRVRFMPADPGKSGGRRTCVAVRPCDDKPQLGLECGFDRQETAETINQSHVAAADIADLGFLAGIFDGHCGGSCAAHISATFPSMLHAVFGARIGQIRGGLAFLSTSKEVELIASALEEACHEVDRDLMRTAQEGHWTDGTSMILALLAHGFDAPKQATVAGCDGGIAKLFLAWCGDSRALLLTGREAKSLSRDHVPSRKDEYARLKQSGGKVLEFDGVLKVGRRDKYKENKQKSSKSSFGNVLWSPTSRSFGDIRLKAPHHIVTSEPEFLTRTLTPGDWALVLVCSGVSSRLSDQDIADACWECLVLRDASVADTAHEVTQRARRRGAQGKLTVLVMRFGWATPRL